MDYRLLAVAFTTTFLAELGDKTQLATLVLASGSKSRLSVFLGSSAALVASSALAVLLGELVTRTVSPLWLQRGAGVLFIGLGALYLFGRGD
jgi:putative Ca2+/H+ antiporter (TMEM165/GDT1 family)